ncbi:MAG: DUF2868 domain-containing protein [Nevskiales bacterium]|nr:DUF2868 domain-containing protein [Nevskiales bacterium]
MAHTPSAPPPPTLAHRLLAEWVCAREERLGHPPQTDAADTAAIRAGGDLSTRIRTRACALPDAATDLRAIQRVLRSGAWIGVALIVLAAIAGVGAAASALDASRPASLPLILLVLVGANILTLLAWSLAQSVGSRITPGLGGILRRAWQWTLARQRPHGREITGPERNPGMLLQLLATSPAGRWMFASAVHAAWLGYALTGVLTLIVLLSVRAYSLSWETTLLSSDALEAWARTLSWGPSLLSAPGPESLPVTGAGDAHEGWAKWLIAATFVYGVIPRAIALALCVTLAIRAQRRFGRDARKPGFARLRTRLLPDHSELGIVDPAPDASAASVPEPTTPALIDRLPRTTLHGVRIEGGRDDAPAIPATDWHWLGRVDDRSSRERVLRDLRDAEVEALVVVVDAVMTPDRGIERYIALLIEAARTPNTFLILDAADRLAVRGEARYRQRVEDWQALARRSGIRGGILPLRSATAGTEVATR